MSDLICENIRTRGYDSTSKPVSKKYSKMSNNELFLNSRQLREQISSLLGQVEHGNRKIVQN